jgi:hypothetical protein
MSSDRSSDDSDDFFDDRALHEIQATVSEIRDAVCAPASSAIPGLIGYALVGAAWGWGVVTALHGDAVMWAIHGVLWPLSAAFHIARWLAGPH